MRKLSLLLSLLLSFVYVVSLSHASSGDITIGNKTYTQSEAQKQIVEPLLKRLEKQKIAKTKLRLINLTIRQYTNKQKIAQKQGKIDLANFYGTIVTTLKGEVSKIPVINVSTANNTSSQNKPKQNTTTSGSVNNGDSSNNVNNITGSSTLSQEDTQKVLIQRNIVTAYNGNGGANQSKSSFISWVVSDFGGPNTYAVEYANTLKFNDTVSTSGTTSSSNGNVVNNSQQSGEAGFYNGTPGMTQQQIAQRLVENDVLTIYVGQGGANQSKISFIQDIEHNYGVNTYAVEYASTFTFNQP